MRVCGWVLGGLVAVVGGCTMANPWFVVVDTTTVESSSGAETTGSPTSSGTTTACASAECTSAGSTSAGSMSAGSMSAGSTTGSVDMTMGAEESSLEAGETSGSSSTTGTGAADTSSSGPGGPFEEVIKADVATCVLLPVDLKPYGGPESCQEAVKSQLMEFGIDGVGMNVDSSFGDAMGRPAWVYMSFDLGALQGAELTSAELKLEVLQTSGSNPGGRVHLTGAFNLGSLDDVAPGPEGPWVDIGSAEMGNMKSINITSLIPDAVPPWLYLVIVPQSAIGVIYKEKSDDPQPLLTVSYMQ